MNQVGYFLIRNAQAFPDRVALIFQDQKVTWQELNMVANRLANSMKKLGIKKGDRITYMFPNCLEILYIWYATQKIGATAVPLNTHLLPDEIIRTIQQADSHTLLYHENYKDKMPEVKEKTDLAHVICCGSTIGAGEQDLKVLLEEGAGEEAQVPMKGTDESLLLFTSGTTGISKGVIRSQQVIRDYALMMALENDNSHRTEILLTHCPLFHTAGMSLVMKMAALSGTLVLQNKLNYRDVLRQIEEYKVTQILLIPPLLYMNFSEVDQWKNYDLSSVKEAQFSGGKCTLEYAKGIFEVFPECSIRVSWGSTETCSPTSAVLTRSQIQEDPERIHCVGKQNALVELRLVNEAGEDVAQGEVGEAIVRSPMVFEGYLNCPELSEKAFRDGWFYTEDLMKKDEEGYYYLMDRKRDIIKTGGENVYAQEVERVLCEHEAIRECAVIAVADHRFGEAVAAAIVLNPGAVLTEEEITEYCKNKMPSYKKPRYIAFLSDLPRNSIGKLQKSVLREKSKEIFGAEAFCN